MLGPTCIIACIIVYLAGGHLNINKNSSWSAHEQSSTAAKRTKRIWKFQYKTNNSILCTFNGITMLMRGGLWFLDNKMSVMTWALWTQPKIQPLWKYTWNNDISIRKTIAYWGLTNNPWLSAIIRPKIDSVLFENCVIDEEIKESEVNSIWKIFNMQFNIPISNESYAQCARSEFQARTRS